MKQLNVIEIVDGHLFNYFFISNFLITKINGRNLYLTIENSHTIYIYHIFIGWKFVRSSTGYIDYFIIYLVARIILKISTRFKYFETEWNWYNLTTIWNKSSSIYVNYSVAIQLAMYVTIFSEFIFLWSWHLSE